MGTLKPMSHVNTCARQHISRILTYGNQVALLSHYLWGPPPWPACLRCRACFVRPACLALFALLALNPTHPNLSTALNPTQKRRRNARVEGRLGCGGALLFTCCCCCRLAVAAAALLLLVIPGVEDSSSPSKSTTFSM